MTCLWSKEKCLKLILFILYAVSSYLLITRGVHFDERMLSFQEMRFVKGDIPLRDVWGPYAVSSWFFSWIIRPFSSLLGNGYWILTANILQLVFLSLSTLMLGFAYKDNRNIWYICLFLCCFLPSYLYSFASHYTFSYDLVIMSITLFKILNKCNAAKKKMIVFLLGLISGLNVIVMPTMVIMIPMNIYIITRLNLLSNCEHKSISSFLQIYYILGGMLVFLMISLALYISGCNSISYIMNLKSGYMHSGGLCGNVVEVLRRICVIALIAIAVLIYHQLYKRISVKVPFFYKQDEFALLTHMCMCLAAMLNLIVCDINFLMKSVYSAFLILGSWALLFFYGNKYKKLDNDMVIFALFGVCYAFIIGLFTNTGAMIVSSGYIFCICGYELFCGSIIIKDNDNSSVVNSEFLTWGGVTSCHNKNTLILLIVILMIQRMAIPDGNLFFPWELKYKIRDGVMEGVYVTKEHYDNYTRVQYILDHHINKEDRIAILSLPFYMIGYSMTEAKCGISDLDPFSFDRSNYLKYWEIDENHQPNVILILDEDQIDEFYKSKSPLCNYIKRVYTKVDDKDDYLILRK